MKPPLPSGARPSGSPGPSPPSRLASFPMIDPSRPVLPPHPSQCSVQINARSERIFRAFISETRGSNGGSGGRAVPQSVGAFFFFFFGSYSSAATSFPGSRSPFRCSRLVVVFFAPCVAHHLQLLTTVTTVLQSGGFSGLQPHTAAKDDFRFSLQNKVNNDVYNISVLLLHEKININIKITIIIIDNYYY